MLNRGYRWFVIASAMALVLPAAALQASGKLTDVTAKSVGNGFEVDIVGQNLPTPKTLKINHGRSVILEFGDSVSVRGHRTSVKAGGLQYVNFGQFTSSPPVARVHIRLENAGTPKIEASNDGWRVTLNSPVASMALKSAEDTFPDKVPPLERPNFPAAPTLAEAASKAFAYGTSTAKVAAFEQRVSLDFSNTDVVQILKALALQAGVNIVTSPQVRGTLTLTLEKVPLADALDLVTTMANLRYAQINNTYVVATSTDLTRAVRELVNRGGAASSTRVVNLASKQASYIREACLKMIPQTGAEGWYEILSSSSGAPATGAAGPDPTKMASPAPSASPNPAGATAPAAAAQGTPSGDGGVAQSPAQNLASPAPGNGGTSGAASPDDAKLGGPNPISAAGESFIVLVGDRRKVDQVAAYIATLDTDILAQQFPVKADMVTRVIPVFSGDIDRIKGNVDKLISQNPHHDDFRTDKTQLSELTANDGAQSLLLVMGPGAEVSRLEQIATMLDDDLCNQAGIKPVRGNSLAARKFEVVSLSYLDPQVAQTDLMTRVRGLTVTLMPDFVRPPNTAISSSSSSGGSSSAGAAGTPSGGAATAVAGPKTVPMKLVLRGSDSQIAEAKQFLAMVDLQPKQIAMELRVMELTKEEAVRFGIDWNMLTKAAVSPIRFNQALTTPGANSVVGAITGHGFDGTVTATLDSIANKGNLISRPNLLAVDGQTSKVFIGDIIQYILSKSTNPTTGEPNIQLGNPPIRAGITLNVTPRVGGNNNIAMAIDTDVSFISSYLDLPGGGQVPQTSNRQVSLSVDVLNGETIALGGLIQDQDTKKVSKVPILGDLPIIGQLFRKTDNDRKRTEVVLFLTARVVNSGNQRKAADPRNSVKANPSEVPSNNN